MRRRQINTRPIDTLSIRTPNEVRYERLRAAQKRANQKAYPSKREYNKIAMWISRNKYPERARAINARYEKSEKGRLKNMRREKSAKRQEWYARKYQRQKETGYYIVRKYIKPLRISLRNWSGFAHP